MAILEGFINFYAHHDIPSEFKILKINSRTQVSYKKQQLFSFDNEVIR